MQLDYLPEDKLGLMKEDLPFGNVRLPAPRQPKWPFANLRDYMRVVGPGMFVGRGWKQPHGSDNPRQGADFLYFVLVQQPAGQ